MQQKLKTWRNFQASFSERRRKLQYFGLCCVPPYRDMLECVFHTGACGSKRDRQKTSNSTHPSFGTTPGLLGTGSLAPTSRNDKTCNKDKVTSPPDPVSSDPVKSHSIHPLPKTHVCLPWLRSCFQCSRPAGRVVEERAGHRPPESPPRPG